METDSRNYGSGCLLQFLALFLIALGLGIIAFYFLLMSAESPSDVVQLSPLSIVLGLVFIAAGAWLFVRGYKAARKNSPN